MKQAAIAAAMFVAMLATVAALRHLPEPLPDLTTGTSQQHSNPWLRPMRVRA